MVYPHKMWWHFISSELQVTIWYLNVWNKNIMTCEKQIQVFVSIFNKCYSWDLSQVCLALISQHSCLESHLPKSKMKMKKTKKLFTYWDCNASFHWFKICISLDFRNILSGQQHTSLPPHGAKRVKTERRGSFRVCISGKLLSAALITGRIFIYLCRVITSFLCSSGTWLKPS